MDAIPAGVDLQIPLPNGEQWPSHTIHTHYFGFTVPEARIGAFIYLRCMPVFEIASGGVCLFQGLDNRRPLDIEHCNYVITMPYPEVKGNVIETANGLKLDFLEPGERVRLTYRSADGRTSFDVVQQAVTPRLPRGHVMPGEDRDTSSSQKPGGLEQFMHCTGELILDGQRYAVDCHPVRDRSWRQVRTEDEVLYPTVGWSPMHFGDDLCFNQVGWEAPDADPVWKGAFDLACDKPTFYFAWVVKDGEPRNVVKVRRAVTQRHPELFAATRQTIEATDEKGDTYRFQGEAIAMAHLPSWPNNIFIDSVYRWTDEKGRVAHCAYQETWYHRMQRHLRGRLKG
ncbi:MAG TPA: hypothetical protein VJM11_09460 [Nevskiaceae bacterium]|nr:hypothetical protein [Nevskiaceae bacterium]